ncbi:hypothetical protein GOV10_05130, partial [Candidatus Woesearchaeota archaeon]|nr:hypothetical protein [Candidatus Woesearchaeota archaeon]
ETTDGLEERLKKEQDWAYKIGAQLVTPILEEYGVEKGIERIYSQDPLTLYEMVHPEEYWERMMD